MQVPRHHFVHRFARPFEHLQAGWQLVARFRNLPTQGQYFVLVIGFMLPSTVYGIRAVELKRWYALTDECAVAGVALSGGPA